MSPASVLAALLAISVLLATAGCGRHHEDRPTFNQVIGDGMASAPAGHRAVDLGILKDQTAYQPAKYTLSEAEIAAGGQEAEAVTARIRSALAIALELDFVALLDVFVPEQVAAITEDTSALEAAVDSIRRLSALLADKGLAAAAGLDALPQKLADAFVDALTVDVIDAEHAVAKIDQAKFQESFSKILAEIGPALTAAGASPGAVPQLGRVVAQPPPDSNDPSPAPAQPTGAPGAIAALPPGGISPQMLKGLFGGAGEGPDEPTSLKLRKLDGDWKIDIERTVRAEESELIRQGAQLVRELCDQLYAKVEAAGPLDQQAFSALLMQTVLPMSQQFATLMTRFRELAARPSLESPATAAEPAAAPQPEKPRDSNEP